MASPAAKASAAALFSFASLEAATTRASTREVAERVLTEIRSSRNHNASQTTALASWTQLYAGQPPHAVQALANVELFLRSKRKHYALMEKYNPLYGMSDKDRIRATARTDRKSVV